MPKTSAYKGVVSSPRKNGAKRYRASLVKEGKMVFSATDLYEDEAALAYDQAAILRFAAVVIKRPFLWLSGRSRVLMGVCSRR